MEHKTILALTSIRNVIAKLLEAYKEVCFETPAFYTGKDIFAFLKEGEENLVIYTEEWKFWWKSTRKYLLLRRII